MKEIKRIFALLVLLVLLTKLVACDRDDPTFRDRQNKVLKTLSERSWRAVRVTRGAQDITRDYENFILYFGNETYSSQNGGLAWAEEGTWIFVDKSLDQIILDGQIMVSMEFRNSNQEMTLKFEINESTYEGGRTASLEGDYEFQLIAM